MIRRHGERGASLIELAFVAPILAMVAFAVVDLGLAYRLRIQLDAAAGEGAAHAVLRPDEVDCDGTEDIVGRVVAAQDDLADRPGFAVTVLAEDGSGAFTDVVTGCGTATVAPGDRVRVEVQADYSVLTPFVGGAIGNVLTIEGSTEIEVVG